MKPIDKLKEKKVSIFHTFVFFLICLFFTGVAIEWELRQRRKFEAAVTYKNFSKEKLQALIEDFNSLKTCRDPYVEHFTAKHPEFATLNRIWLINSCEYWLKKLKRELKRENS
jgi:hypothetical protein